MGLLVYFNLILGFWIILIRIDTNFIFEFILIKIWANNRLNIWRMIEEGATSLKREPHHEQEIAAVFKCDTTRGQFEIYWEFKDWVGHWF